VAIYPQASGPISEVLVRNGDKVEKGDPLVRIRPVLPESQLAQARANLAAAKAEVGRAGANVEELEAGYSRTRLLAGKDLVSEEQLETERAQMEAASATPRWACRRARRPRSSSSAAWTGCAWRCP
jgi:HlyD family secretion protein